MRTSEYVTRVIDGDTFTTAGQSPSVRLQGVNAPERGQIGHQEATEELTRLILQRQVTIQTKARDVYGRRVADVWRESDGLHVNSAMRAHLGQMSGRSYGFRR